MLKLGLVCAGLVGILTVGCAGAENEGVGSETSATTSAAAKCTPDQQALAWAEMVRAPISPNKVGGVELLGATIDDVEHVLCAGNVVSKEKDNVFVAWGDANELTLGYDIKTRKIVSWVVSEGYRGTIAFKSRPSALGDPSAPNPFGQHTYSLSVGVGAQRDGAPWALDVEGNSAELFDAMMFTFSPDQPSTQVSCIDEGSCLARVFATNNAIFGARALGMYLYINDATAPEPARSTPSMFYGFVR